MAKAKVSIINDIEKITHRSYNSSLHLQKFKMAVLTKIKKKQQNKLLLQPEPLGLIGYKFAWNINGTLVFKIVKKEKKSATAFDHSDLHSVYPSNFAQMPISQENINVFWSHLIIIVP